MFKIYSILFLFIACFSFNAFTMPSLEKIMGEGFESDDITEEQVLHTILLRCSAASYFLIGGDQQDNPDDLGDYFKEVAFGMGVIVSGQLGTMDKTAGEIREENQKLIDKYYENYKEEGFDWYKKKGMPSEPELTYIYSDFFNKDMIYCVEINEEFGPGSKKN